MGIDAAIPKNTRIPYDFLRFRIIGPGVHFKSISRQCYFSTRKTTISPGGLEAMLQNHAFSIGNIAFSEKAPKSSSGAVLGNRKKNQWNYICFWNAVFLSLVRSSLKCALS